MTMTTTPNLRVLFFDVFGTCVAQRPSVAKELWEAAQAALQSKPPSMNDEVRAKVERMSYDDWFEFGGEWNRAETKFTHDIRDQTGTVDWREVDRRRIALLPELLANHKLVVARKESDGSLTVQDGSLWTATQLEHLGRVWHRLVPWPDTCRGLDLFNTKYETVTLSNTYNIVLESLKAHSSIPFKQVFSADMFHSFKPNRIVYLSAAEKMGVKPEECALVAAHLGDLKGAKACGFYCIYVERPLEEKQPELTKEDIPDLWIKENEQGFITVAERLGINVN